MTSEEAKEVRADMLCSTCICYVENELSLYPGLTLPSPGTVEDNVPSPAAGFGNSEVIVEELTDAGAGIVAPVGAEFEPVGMCHLNPQTVIKSKEDWCMQWRGR